MKKNLVLAGGGHAHMVTLANLHQFVEKGYNVTVIGPSAHHYYSGMGPGMLGKTYKPEEIRFATQHVVEKKGGTLRSHVTEVAKLVRAETKQQKQAYQSKIKEQSNGRLGTGNSQRMPEPEKSPDTRFDEFLKTVGARHGQ